MDNLKLYNGLPLMEAKMNEDDTGIYCVSFVSDPATEIGWVTFADEKETVKFAIENEKEHIVSGIIMVASTPIYRIDSYGAPYYIIYSKDTLKYMAEKMLKEGFTSSVNIQHKDGSNVDGVNLMEIYVIDKEKGICPTYFENVPDGSLVGTYKVRNNEVWEMIEKGEVLSFSLEGIFDLEPVFENNNKKTYNIMNLIEKFMKKLMKFEEISTDKGVLLTIEGEELAIGVEVYVPVEDGWEPAADGEYKLDDDEIIVVVDGKISEIKEVEQKVEKEEEPIVVTTAEEKEVEPKVEERDVVKEQIDGLKAEIETLKNEIADLKNTLSNIVSKPAVEPIVEEFEKVKNVEIKGNKAAKLFANLKK